MENGTANILVFGAGVTGSLLASRLHGGGADVTILARGERFEEILRDGIRIVHVLQERETVEHVPVIRELPADPAFDLVIVALRKNQIPQALPILSAARRCRTFLFFGNDGTAGADAIGKLGEDRVLPGFPSSGGRREAGIIRAVYREETPITIGEPAGRITDRVNRIQETLTRAGVPVEISDNIEAWLTCHLALVLPLAAGIYRAGGDNYALSRRPDELKLIVRAIREGFAACRAAGFPIRPKRLGRMPYVPDFLITKKLKAVFGSVAGELGLRDHAMAAPDEMKILADEFRMIIRRSGRRPAALEELYADIDRQAVTGDLRRDS